MRMLHVSCATLAVLVPAVLSCGAVVGRRAGQAEDRFVHVHIVVYGRVFCAFVRPDGKSGTVSLELGNRASPNNYLKINSTAYAGHSEGVKFTLSGDYSYDTQTNCLLDKPRVSVRGHCGDKDLYDLKPFYEEELGDWRQRLEIYDLGDIHPVGPF